MTDTTNGLLVTDGDRRWFIPDAVLEAHELPDSVDLPDDGDDVTGFVQMGEIFSAKKILFFDEADAIRDPQSQDRISAPRPQRGLLDFEIQ